MNSHLCDEQTIISGAPYQEIVQYLLTISSNANGRLYEGDNWQIFLQSQEDVRMGSLKLSKTTLVFRGEEASVRFQVESFRRRFLSAGG